MGEFHGCWIMIEETFPFAIRLPTFYSISICLATISPKDPLTYLLLLKPHPFWLIVAVPTTSADASLPSPRVKSSFPSQPTDRNTADDKIDVLESLLLAFSPYRIVSPRLLLQGYVPALDRVWLRRRHNFESCQLVHVSGDNSVKAKPEFSLFFMSTNRQQLASQLCLGTDGMY